MLVGQNTLRGNIKIGTITDAWVTDGVIHQGRSGWTVLFGTDGRRHLERYLDWAAADISSYVACLLLLPQPFTELWRHRTTTGHRQYDDNNTI